MSGLETRLGSLTLRNPILTASGTFGYGLEFQPIFDIARLGGICTKGLSVRERPGNPPARICETPSGMLNAIGLANVGVQAFVETKLPELRKLNATVIANIFGSSIEEFVSLTETLNQVTGVAALELNVSCPNVTKGGVEFGKDPGAAREVTRAVCQASRLPVWVKLSPEAGDIVAVAKAAAEGGCEALSVMNTIRGVAVDVRTRRFVLANRTGGLSGPAIKPLALRLVHDVYRAVPLPIVGIGGISTWQDAVEFLLVGATAVQVGTASFVNPRASMEVLEGLERYCESRGCSSQELIGTVMDA